MLTIVHTLTCMQVSSCGLDVSHLCIILYKMYSCVVLYKMFALLQIQYTYIHILYSISSLFLVGLDSYDYLECVGYIILYVNGPSKNWSLLSVV